MAVSGVPRPESPVYNGHVTGQVSGLFRPVRRLHADRGHRHRDQLRPHDCGAGPARSVVRGHRSRERHGPARRRRPRRPEPHADRDGRRAPDARRSSDVLPTPTGSTRSSPAATSATREAENGGDFLAEVDRADRHSFRVISGTEEARLIHLAAGLRRRRRQLDRRSSSTSAAAASRSRWAPATQLALGKSFKIGVIRLTERFVKTDPLAGARRAATGEARQQARSAAHRADRRRAASIASSAPRARSSASGLWPRRTTRQPRRRPAQPRASAPSISPPAQAARRCRHRGAAADARPRSAARRSRRSPARCCSTRSCDASAPSEFTLCDLALREGLVLDYIQRNSEQSAGRALSRRPPPQHHRARRAVQLLVRRTRSRWRVSRSRSSTRPAAVHGLADREREWLEFGALLHDVGVHISYERHHKHSYYLIKNGDLRGFEPDEIEIIAPRRPLSPAGNAEEVARRLRRPARPSAPDRPDAVGDRAAGRGARPQPRPGHRRARPARPRRRLSRCGLHTAGDAELELWAAHRHVAPLEAVLGKPVRFEGRAKPPPWRTTTPHAEHPDHTPRVSGKAVRRRGHRRVRKDDAAGAAGQVAERRRPSRVRHRVELVGAGQGRDQDRQEEERAHADDVQPAARHRLR